MALATYADLQASVASWLRRADLTAQIPDFIVLVESEMNTELQTAWQLAEQTYAITGEFTALPTGFRQMRTLRLTSGTGRLLREITPEEMAKRKAVPSPLSAEPREYTAIGAELEFYPVPDQSYAAVMELQTGITPLSDANPSNWILASFPNAYLYGALAAGSAYAKNFDAAETWNAKFLSVLNDIGRALRTTYDRTLRVDPALTRAGRRTNGFNWMTGD